MAIVVPKKKLTKKQKELPRFRTIAQYEGAFKMDYIKGLSAALVFLLKGHNKMLKKNVVDTVTDK